MTQARCKTLQLFGCKPKVDAPVGPDNLPVAFHVYAAILEPKQLGELLRAIEAFGGSPVTIAALKIAPHVFVRPGELRHAEWSEFDLKTGHLEDVGR